MYLTVILENGLVKNIHPSHDTFNAFLLLQPIFKRTTKVNNFSAMLLHYKLGLRVKNYQTTLEQNVANTRQISVIFD